jgi:hypothetical protein
MAGQSVPAGQLASTPSSRAKVAASSTRDQCMAHGALRQSPHLVSSGVRNSILSDGGGGCRESSFACRHVHSGRQTLVLFNSYRARVSRAPQQRLCTAVTVVSNCQNARQGICAGLGSPGVSHLRGAGTLTGPNERLPKRRRTGTAMDASTTSNVPHRTVRRASVRASVSLRSGGQTTDDTAALRS